MAVIVLCTSITVAVATAWLVEILASPYEIVAALLGSVAAVLLLVVSLCIDE